MVEVKYLADGREVEFVGGTAGAWVVRPVLEDEGTGEPIGLGWPEVVAEVFDVAPVERVSAELAALQAQLAEARQSLQEVLKERRALNVEIGERRRCFEASPVARGLQAALDGSAWWVVEPDGLPIAAPNSALRQVALVRPETRLLVVLEQVRGPDGVSMRWRLADDERYKNLGMDPTLYVFEHEARAEVRRRIHERMRRGVTAVDVMQRLLDHARAVGVEPLPGYAESLTKLKRQAAAKSLAVAQAALAKAEEAMRALDGGAGDGVEVAP